MISSGRILAKGRRKKVEGETKEAEEVEEAKEVPEETGFGIARLRLLFRVVGAVSKRCEFVAIRTGIGEAVKGVKPVSNKLRVAIGNLPPRCIFNGLWARDLEALRFVA